MIDSFDDIVLASGCFAAEHNTETKVLQRAIDNLRLIFQQLNQYLVHHLGGIHKIYAFGTSSGLRTLFTGIPLHDLTGKSALKGLFGFSRSDVQVLVEEIIPKGHVESFMDKLLKTCQEYVTYYDDDKGVSDPVYYPREILAYLEASCGTEQAIGFSKSMNYNTVEMIRNFVGMKFQQNGFVHLGILLADDKQPIHPTHLLNHSNLSQTLLESVLVDFGFYKAATCSDHVSSLRKRPGYIPCNITLLDNVCGL